MTRRAAGQLAGTSDVVFFHQLLAEDMSIGLRLPIHIKYLLARSQELFRATMAVKAPFHLQSLVLPHERHAIDASMAGRAADTFVNVNAVVKINEVGQVVHPRPANRHAALVTIAHRLENIAAGPDL